MENKQRPVIAETRELVQKYHVLEKAQIYDYFALDGRDHFVGKAFKALEKRAAKFLFIQNWKWWQQVRKQLLTRIWEL